MTEHSDHRAAATRELQRYTDLEYPNPHVAASAAQAHALLAVEKQLRVANALTALSMSTGALDDQDPKKSTSPITIARIHRRNALAAVAREGLGLA